MPRWVLGCPECHVDFTHSEITRNDRPSGAEFLDFLTPKPEFPDGGMTVECPHCKVSSVFQRHQLLFRSK